MPDPADLRSFSGPWPTQRSVERRHRCKIRYANGFQRNIFIGPFVPLERTCVLERPPFLSLCYVQWSDIQYVSYRVWGKFYRFNPSNTWNFLQQKEALRRKKNKKSKIKIKKKIKKTSSRIPAPLLWFEPVGNFVLSSTSTRLSLTRCIVNRMGWAKEKSVYKNGRWKKHPWLSVERKKRKNEKYRGFAGEGSLFVYCLWILRGWKIFTVVLERSHWFI